MMNILIVQNKILHYRKPFYNLLSSYHAVTVLHSGSPTVTQEDKYSEIVVPYTKIGPFIFQKNVIHETRNKKYNYVVCMHDLHWVNNIISMILFKNKSKFIWWGLDCGKSWLVNKIKILISKNTDCPVIFYTAKIMEKFISLGLDENKLYVANNTFDVKQREPCYLYSNKDLILFVGSLDGRKQNEVLLSAFKGVIGKISSDIRLCIVGKGDEEERLKILVKELDIEKRVLFEGPINDPDKLLEYYKRTIVTVSFGQAGLTVLQSFAYGVPYITKHNCITGGEAGNIINNKNGLLCEDSLESLKEAVLFSCMNLDLMRVMGESAYAYYSSTCTMRRMVLGFCKALA